ncbi:MAG: response regulator [Nitrospiria bacterium]
MSGEGEATERPTILVVDDEPSVRRALQRLFAREQYRVLDAGGAEEALKLVAANPIDLIITDYAMPECNGLELLVRMKKSHPEIVRMIMTGKADLQAVISAINEGHVYRFILKPWDNDDLSLSVRLALEQSRLLLDNRRLIGRLQRQEEMLRTLSKHYPGITTVERDADGAIVLDDPDEAA